MQQLNNLSNDAFQLVTYVLDDGTTVQLTFSYRPGIGRWTMDLVHEDLTLAGINLCVFPNILRQWKNIIPFGMAIISNNGLDPIQPNDFVDGIVTVNMLTAEEVQQVESEILAPIPLVNP